MRRALILLLGAVLAGAVACGGAEPAAAPAVLSAEPTPQGTYRGLSWTRRSPGRPSR